MWIWDLGTRDPVQTFSTGAEVDSVVCVQVDGRLAVVTGARHGDGLVRDAATGATVGLPLPGHFRMPERTRRGRSWMQDMASTTLDGRAVMLTVGKSLRMWDPATGQLIAELTAPGSAHMAQVTCTELDGRPLAVAACNGGALLVWDLSERALIGQPMGGGTGGVGSVVCTDLDGCRVALTGDLNGIVRIWDLKTRTLLATAVTPADADAAPVNGMAYAEVDDRPVVVTSSIYQNEVSCGAWTPPSR